MNSLDIEVDEHIVTIIVSSDTDSQTLEEARYRGRPLTGTYSARHDTPRTPHAQHHIHIYKRGNEICAINQDGTGHDGSHGFPLPNKVAGKLRQEFPTWHIPDNNIIECVTRSQYVMNVFAR